MTQSPEVLTFESLEPHLLLKNGNFLYKVPHGDGFVVVKVYYGSRGAVSRVVKSVENVMLAGQTSYMPMTRLRIERECIEIWKKHGFRVFDIYDHIKVVAPECPDPGYLVLEYVNRPKLIERMTDESVPIDDRFKLWNHWLVEWSRRHDIAIAEREPRLVHENGDGKHVMLMEDGSYLWFDFEMIWRSRRKVRDHVSHEIMQYLWHTHKTIADEHRERLLDETIANYPVRARLEETFGYFFQHPNPFHRLGRVLDRAFFKRTKKPTSKYNVARKLKARLAAAAAAAG
ncbi:MAG: hypothetical protein ACYS22_04595 [Planctomycetota bacterium]|jgi:hypothetical protein